MQARRNCLRAYAASPSIIEARIGQPCPDIRKVNDDNHSGFQSHWCNGLAHKGGELPFNDALVVVMEFLESGRFPMQVNGCV